LNLSKWSILPISSLLNPFSAIDMHVLHLYFLITSVYAPAHRPFVLLPVYKLFSLIYIIILLLLLYLLILELTHSYIPHQFILRPFPLNHINILFG
jgi:hypothetical protein